ncbi:MAG: hypothetical protein H7336_08885 [Bacteriovorax sp.]|nr:hypothetical protein [Bacteriovorax sp.]
MTAYTKNILFTSLLISITTIPLGYSADQKKQFYFLGGGGEPKGETTIFDGEIKRVGSFINNSDWDSTVSFNGGHAKTEDLMRSKMAKAKNAGPFIEKNYNAMMDEMIAKLESGELKAGDQLMVAIDTHGAKRSIGKDAEKTHRVALSYSEAKELTNLSGARTVDLDKLDKIADLAGKKGVKLAVADLSCYSGNLLNIKSDKVCLISGSGPEQYSYGAGTLKVGFLSFSQANTFSSKFFDSLKKGKNLEDLFLSARSSSTDTPDFPMINTSAGIAINDLIYKMITPYLDYNNDQVSNFGRQYGRTGDGFEERICNIDSNHHQLIDLLKQYNSLSIVADESGRNSDDFKALRSALEEYRSYQKTYEVSMRGKFEAEKEVRNIFEKQFPNDKKAWSEYDPLDFLTIDLDLQIKRYQEYADREKNNNNKYVAVMMDLTLSQLKKQKEIAAYVKANLSENSKAKLKAQEDAYGKSGVTKNLASRVSLEAKKVFNTLYKSLKKPESNPCRDFVL